MSQSLKTIALMLASGVLAILTSSNAIAADADSYRCQALFVPKTTGPLETTLKEVPSLFKSITTFKTKDRKTDIEFNKQVTEDRALLLKTRENTAKAVIEALGENPKVFKNKTLDSRGERLRGLAFDDITHASTIAEIEAYKRIYDTTIRQIATEDANLDAVYREFSANLTAATKEIPPLMFERAVKVQIDRLHEKFSAIADLEELKQSSQALIEEVRHYGRQMREKNEARRKAEFRFDVKDTTNSQDLADAFLRLQKMFVTPELESTIDPIILVKAMSKSAPLKTFVYGELRFYRLAAKSDVLQTDPGTALRARNNVAVIAKTLELAPAYRDAFIAPQRAMRKGIRILARPRNFAKVLPKGSLRPFSSVLREKIFAETLTSPHLVTAITGSIVVLPELPMKPVTKPSKPVKPARPNFESMSKSYKKSARRDYNYAKENYARAKQNYAVAMTRFQMQREAYAAAVVKSKAIESRRLAAREAFVGYLAQNHPTAFNASSEQRMPPRAVARTIVQRQRTIVDRRLSRFNQTQIHQTHEQVSDNSDWFMMFLTGNPMWIISPTIARIQLFTDLMSGSSNRLFNDLAGNYHDGPVGATGNWDLAQQQAAEVANYELNSPEYQQLANTVAESAILDADLRMGGTSLQDLTPDVTDAVQDAAARADDAIDAATGDSGNLETDRETGDGTVTDGNRGDEWEDFVRQSDADWKDDAADTLNDDTNGDGPAS